MCRLRNEFFVPAWRRIFGVGILVLASLGARTALAQPANDNFANATDLSPYDFFGSGSYSDNNTGATLEPGEPTILTNTGGASVWYTWTPTVSGMVSLTTSGAGFHTLLAVYTGNNISNLNVIAADNGSLGGNSQVTFIAVAGTTFDIAVDGTNGAHGPFTLNWATALPTAAPTNDMFADATVISGSSGTTYGYNLFATLELFEPEMMGNPGGASIWYSWTAPSDGIATFDTEGSTFDTLLGVDVGTDVSFLFQIAENDDAIGKRSSVVSFPVTAGTTYEIDVDGYNSTVFSTNAAQGFVVLNWSLAPLPSNDNFANATSLGSATNGSISGNNLGATAENNEPSHASFAANSSVWYTWTAPASGDVEMDTIGSSIDTVLAVYTGNSVSALNQVAANDDLFPTIPYPSRGSVEQLNDVAENYSVTNVSDLFGYTDTNNPPNPDQFAFSYYGVPEYFAQPYTGLPVGTYYGAGVSGLHFNATAGTTYHIAVDGKFGSAGPFMLNWAYHPSGVFRFASETVDKTSGVPVKGTSNPFIINTNFLFRGGPTLETSGNPGMLLYQVSETESTRRPVGPFNVNQYNTTIHSYYYYDAPGLLVTITRVAGSSGRVTVGYTTVDGDQLSDHYTFDTSTDPVTVIPDGISIPLNGDAPAHGTSSFLNDYTPVSGTLTFDDFEMSKTIFIRITDDGGLPRLNRDFAVVLFDPQVASTETGNISTPRLDPVFSQALVRILDTDINPLGPSREKQTNSIPAIVNGVPTNVMVTNLFFSLQPTNAQFNFQKSNYRVPEDVGNYWGATPITIYVNRSGTNTGGVSCNYRINNFFLDDAAGDDEANNYFPLAAASDYAIPNPPGQIGGVFGTAPADFDGAANGTLTWGDNDFASKPITFTVLNNTLTEFNRDFQVELYAVKNNAPYQVGMVAATTVTILFDDSNAPAGSVDEWYNPDFSSAMVPPLGLQPLNQPGTEPQGQVNAVVMQTNDESIIGGAFATYNGNTVGGIARVDTSGQLDTSFNAGDGISVATGDFITSLALQSNGQVIVGGSFNSFNGTTAGNVARLNTDGSLDVAFIGASGSGANGPVRSLFVRPDGTIMIAGDFTTYNGVARNHLARLNPDGSLDATFDPGLTLNGSVYAVAQTPDGINLMVGGDFTSAGGVYGQDHIARLLGTGTLDTTFDPGSGANGRVRTIAVQANGQVVFGGDFTAVNGQSANHIARFNTDGTLDTQFFSGIGTDGLVYDLNYIPMSITTNGIILSTNAEKMYVGGNFTLYNGTHRLGFARLNIDGSLDTTFLDTAYNQFAGLPRANFGDQPNAVFASAVQSDGNVIIGGSFTQVGGGQFDPFDVRPDSTDLNEWPEPKSRNGVRNRVNVARLVGGATPGPGNIGLINSSYSINKSQGFDYVLLTRTNGTLGCASANFSLVPGTAQPGLSADYTYAAGAPFYNETWEYIKPTRRHSDGLWGTNTVMYDVFGAGWSLGINGPSSVIVGISGNPLTSGNVNAQLQLANPAGADQFYLGGQNIPLGIALGRSIAPFTIVDDGKKPGVFGFSSPTYTGTGSVPISVIRTNGNFNSSPITVNYITSAGPYTTNGVDYVDTSGTLTYNNGDTNKTFNVQIIQSNYVSSVEKSVNLNVYSLQPNIPFGLSNAVLRIINPNFQGFLNFSSTNYVTNLNAGAIQFIVERNVGSKGTLDVQYTTTNITALAGTDYVRTTGTLHWNDGDVSPRTVSVPLLNSGAVGGTNSFGAYLFNPLLNGSSAPSLLGTVTNTTLTIINDNNYGIYEFSSPTYVVNEASNGFATVTVLRTSSVLSNASIQFATVNGTAFAGTNYVATNGTLSFVQGQTAASFTVRILNDGIADPFPFFFNVVLTNASTGALLGSPTNAQVNIVDAQSFNRPPGSGDVTFDQLGINGAVLALALQTNGDIIAGGNFTTVSGLPRNYFARLNPDGTLDNNFLNGLSGANGPVSAAVVQDDGYILLGGSFSSVDAVVRHRIARVATDGSLDPSFNPGAGADNSVFAVAQTYVSGARKIYVGGGFTTLGTSSSQGFVRLNNSGTIDPTFGCTGVNGTVYAIAIYPTNSVYAGKVLIAGSFVSVNGINQTNIARLNVDGSLDTNFNASADGVVRALAIQNDDDAVLGGEFAHVNGSAATRLARLNTDGSLDTTFVANVSPGASDTVETIAMQADNRILVGGQFTTANGVTRNHITRLLPSGLVDPTINFGDGANGAVDVILVQPLDQMILVGGSFTQYNDQPAPYLTRIYGGSATDSGAFEFTSPTFEVNENGIQALITVRRTGGTSGPNPDGSGNVSVQFATSPGSAVPNVNYTSVSSSVSFPPGEVLEKVFVPVIDDGVITSNLTVNLALSSPSASAGLGDQTNAVLSIIETDNNISFSSGTFQVAKNTLTGVANIAIVRNGGSSGVSSVNFSTTTNGTAVAGTDYYPTNITVTFNPGVTQQVVQVGIINNNLPEGNRTVTMSLSNVVGSVLASPSNAVLTIVDTTFSPGQLYFDSTNFFSNEGDPYAVITVDRTNGTSGTVSAFYYTVPGTAQPGVSYESVSNTITLSDGQTSATFDVPMVQNSLILGTVNFGVVLATNLNSGTTIAYPSNATVFIADDNSGFLMVNATNSILETTTPQAVTVLRVGPTNSTLQVQYATQDGTAVAGVNYTATTGTLTYNPGETSKSILVPILDDPAVTGTLQFSLALSNPTPGSRLGYPSTNYIEVLDADAGISFTNATMTVRRNVGQAVVTVITTNPAVEPPILNSNTIPMSVQYTTSDGTALAGLDYIKTSGTLVFTNGNGTNTFLVPIINNSESGTRTFNVSLFNPTLPGRLVAPSNQAISIIDATAGFKFSGSAYSVNKTAGIATITVYRTGVTTNTASVDFLATNGTAIPAVQYYPTNGTLVFTNGVTNLTFGVQVIDTATVQPNESVLLELSNPTNGVMGSPSAATLTIKDNTGSYVVPAGSQLVSESGAGSPNGVVDSNETVTVLFAFRDAGGLNVNNLIATLLTTNGVTSPSPASQAYGPLISSGHSVFKPFTFTAEGTNGQQIAATFQLQDGTTNIGTGVFGYTLGSSTYRFTNSASILINDDNTASPYPSVVSVSNLVGSVLNATITLTNVIHTSPHDIDALLVSPTEQSVLFMAHCGGQIAISNVTLTFDDTASTALSSSTQINSGTNKPSAYLPVPIFP